MKDFVWIQFCIQSEAGLIVRNAKEHLQNDNEQISDCNLLFPACNLQLLLLSSSSIIHNAQNCPGHKKNEKLYFNKLGSIAGLISTGSSLHFLLINFRISSHVFKN